MVSVLLLLFQFLIIQQNCVILCYGDWMYKKFIFVGCVTCSNGLFVLMPFPPRKIQLSLKPKLVTAVLPKSAISFLASSLSLQVKDRCYFNTSSNLINISKYIHMHLNYWRYCEKKSLLS